MNDQETFNNIVKNLRNEGFGHAPKLTTEKTEKTDKPFLILFSILWLFTLAVMLASVALDMPIIGVLMFVCLVKFSDSIYKLLRTTLVKSMLKKTAERQAHLLTMINGLSKLK